MCVFSTFHHYIWFERVCPSAPAQVPGVTPSLVFVEDTPTLVLLQLIRHAHACAPVVFVSLKGLELARQNIGE